MKNYTQYFVWALLLLFSLGLQSAYADDWMGKLSDELRVNQLSIPGTHDAGTGHGFYGGLAFMGDSYARTQDKTITEQWESGIRAFDLRPCVDGSDLRINHGVIQTALTLSEALTTLCDLLDQHPTEMAIVLIRHETEGDDSSKEWNGMMTTILGSEPVKSHAADFVAAATLGEMRGKLLVLSRDAYATKPIGGFITGWSHSSAFNNQKSGKIKGSGTLQSPCYIQDFYECAASGAKDTKRQSILTLMAYTAEKNSNKRLWAINHTSGYSLTESFFGNELATSDGYRDNAATQNAAVIEWLSEHSGPTGLVMMDFAGVDSSNGYAVKSLSLTKALIKNNDKLPTGIENIDEAEEVNDNILYDLSGRRVNTDNESAQPGIYIKNGKKVLLK